MPLRAALIGSGATLEPWLADGIELAAGAGVLHIAATIDVPLAERGLARFERHALRLQQRLEGLGDAQGRPLPPAPSLWVRPGAALPPLDDIDLLIACDDAVPAHYAACSRLGMAVLTTCGTPGVLGAYRAMLHGFQPFEAAVHLFPPGGGCEVLARAPLAPPDRARLADAQRVLRRPAARLFAQALQRLALGEAPASHGPAPAACAAPASLASIGRYAARRAGQSLRGRGQALQPERFWLDEMQNWFLGWRVNASSFVHHTDRFRPEGFRPLLPPKDGYYADPCVITVEGRDHVFFEDWRADRQRGAIAWMVLDERGRLSAPETVLAEPHHLSYPFVFHAEDAVFMIPESGATGNVCLYRAEAFPRRWKLEATLLAGEPAVDATVARIGGRWWMFVAMGDATRNNELHVYWAERVQGPWHAHAANPVKIDAGSARPAGALFRRRGRLIRPAQDCSRAYGSAVTLNEVTLITPERFEERPVERLDPAWLPGIRGMHTLTHGRRLEMVDARMRARPWCRFPLRASPLRPEERAVRAAPPALGANG